MSLLRTAIPLGFWAAMLLAVLPAGHMAAWAAIGIEGGVAALLLACRPGNRPVVIYDGDCGICNRIRRVMQRVDFGRLFEWQPFQSGAGGRWGIPVPELQAKLHLVYDGRVTSGFRACKRLLLYNPVTHLTLCALIAPFDSPLWRRLVAGLALAFFFPLFNPIGEWVYMLVARNRHRIGPKPTCAAEPQGLAKQ